jgi:hypothetical protein
MSDKLHKLLEAKTAIATAKMVEAAQAQYEDDLSFAQNFIEAQYQVILCLIDEKMNLLDSLLRAAKENLPEPDSMLLSGNES